MSLSQLSRATLVLGTIALVGCSESSTGPGVTPGTLAVNALANTGIRQGESGAADVTINRGGYTGRVQLVPSGVPAGVSVWFAPHTLPPGSEGAAVAGRMNIAVDIGATPGTYPITVTAVGVETGATQGSTTFNLTVIPSIVVTVTPNPVAMHVPDQQTLNVSVTNATNTAVTWSSSNTAVATVNSAGVVTAVGRGSATITARSVENNTRTGTTTINVVSTPVTLGTPITGLSNPGARGSRLWWTVNVPAGTTQLRATLAGGTGDADLYIFPAYTPSGYSGVLCFSENASNNELCVVNNPAPGRYFVLVETWDPWAGATLTVTTTP